MRDPSEDSVATPSFTGNGDESTYARYEASFTKLLEHDAEGVLTDAGVAQYEALVAALETGDFDALDAVRLRQPQPPQGSARRVLINPRAAFSPNLVGPAVDALDMPAAPRMNSRQAAAELLEVYAAAVLRDVPFTQYNGDPDVASVAAVLDAFGEDFQGPRGPGGVVTPRLVLRGPSAGDRVGPYVSQFLLMPFFPLFPSGCAPFVGMLTGVDQLDLGQLRRDQRYPTPSAAREFLTTEASYAAVQNGELPETFQVADYDYAETYMRNGRQLGGLVHVDGPYEAYYNAMNILAFRGAAFSREFPYNQRFAGQWIANQSDGHTMGPSDVFTLIAQACILAFKAAWANKWRAHRRLRPEVMAARLHHTLKGVDLSAPAQVQSWLDQSDDPSVNPYGLHADLVRVGLPVLQMVRSRPQQAGTLLLGQMYPEGSPGHPAYPSGHATVAGACTTVLKAFFDDEAELPELPSNGSDPVGYVRTDDSGSQLLPFGGAARLTVGGELDKLASNISHGRDFGGVHFRSDGDEGMLLGERVAIGLLQAHAQTYVEAGFEGYVFTRRDGVRVRVSPEGVRELT